MYPYLLRYPRFSESFLIKNYSFLIYICLRHMIYCSQITENSPVAQYFSVIITIIESFSFKEYYFAVTDSSVSWAKTPTTSTQREDAWLSSAPPSPLNARQTSRWHFVGYFTDQSQKPHLKTSKHKIQTAVLYLQYSGKQNNNKYFVFILLLCSMRLLFPFGICIPRYLYFSTFLKRFITYCFIMTVSRYLAVMFECTHYFA